MKFWFEVGRVAQGSIQRSSIGAVGVRLCSSAQLAMPLKVKSLKLPDFVQGSGQPLTTAQLCFMLKYRCQAPIAANAHVSWRHFSRYT